MNWNPPHSWYEPPEPKPCCREAEDDPDHDPVACLAEQAETAAEAKADREMEDAWEERWERRYVG